MKVICATTELTRSQQYLRFGLGSWKLLPAERISINIRKARHICQWLTAQSKLQIDEQSIINLSSIYHHVITSVI